MLIISGPLFFVFSKLISHKLDFFEWVYILIPISLTLNLCKKKRVEQLKLIFNSYDLIKLRLIEQLCVVLPFAAYLIYEGHYYHSLGLIGLASVSSIYVQKNFIVHAIPTPFKRIPFEFIVGFRKTFILLFGVYFLLFQSYQVDNFNLALFCLGATFLILCSFYFYPEEEHFVWIYEMNTIEFLRHKLLFGITGGMIAALPLVLILLLTYSEKWLLILGIALLGIFVLIAIILAKYSAFPHEMNLPQVILFTLCLVFPFLLIVAIPIFYLQAKRKLLPILG